MSANTDTTSCNYVNLELQTGCMNDSVGKIGIDQLDQATSEGKGRMKRAEQAKAFPGHLDACRETQQVCLYYAQKLVLHHEFDVSFFLSSCLDRISQQSHELVVGNQASTLDWRTQKGLQFD